MGAHKEADSVEGLGTCHLRLREAMESNLPLSGSQGEVWSAIQFFLASKLFFG